jgi:maltooligosyltrehalose synthase
LASELNVLANRLTRIALSKRRTCDFTLNSLRDALTEVVASFPVYRTYVSPSPEFRRRMRATSGGHRLGQMEKSGGGYQYLRFHQRGASDPHRGRTRFRLQRRSHELRHEIPAIHQPGDGQRPGRHGLLPLQPAGVVE